MRAVMFDVMQFRTIPEKFTSLAPTLTSTTSGFRLASESCVICAGTEMVPNFCGPISPSAYVAPVHANLLNFAFSCSVFPSTFTGPTCLPSVRDM